MGWVPLIVQLSLRRIRSSRALLALIAAVTFSTITLVAIAAIYSQTLGEAGLRHALASVGPNSLQMRVVVNDRPMGEADYLRLRDAVEKPIEARLGWLKDYQHRHGHSQSVPMGITEDGTGQMEMLQDKAFVFFQTGLQDKVDLVEGRWPSSRSDTANPETVALEVLVGASVARREGWVAGTEIVLFPYGTSSDARALMRIVGVMEPRDAGELYWLGDTSYFDLMAEGSVQLAPIFLREEDFFGKLGAAYPTVMVNYWWFTFLDVGKLNISRVGKTRHDLQVLETDINKALPRSLVLTGLGPTLGDFQQKLVLSRVPLLLFVALVVGVLLYFLVLAMNLLVRSRSREMALLRGRGASAWQAAVLLVLGEGVLITAVSVAAAPLVAWGIVRAFLAGSLSPAGVADPASLVTLTRAVWLLSVCVGIAVLLILLLVSLYSSRAHLADFLKERARPPGVPLIHRYYLDALVLVILGVLFWQVHVRGGFVSERLLGEFHIEPSLLFGPAIALLAAGLVLLRLLPLLLRMLSIFSERALPVWLSFPLKRMAREPVAYGLLATVLLTASALGIFAAVFHTSLVQSQKDQTAYTVPGDIVVKEPMNRAGDWATAERLQALPGVQMATAVYRGQMRIVTEGAEPQVNALGISPEALNGTVGFRFDFSNMTPGELSDILAADNIAQSTEVWLPEGAESLGIWCKLQDYTSIYLWRPNLWVRVMDSDGRYTDVSLGEIPIRYEWRYLEAALPAGSNVKGPLRLVALYLGSSDTGNRSTGRLFLDVITAKGQGLPAEGVVVDDFEAGVLWRPLPGRTADISQIASIADAAHDGRYGLDIQWNQTGDSGPIGIIATRVPQKLNIIGGPTFQEGQELVLRVAGYFLPVRVAATVKFFPTLYPQEGSFILLNVRDLSRYAKEMPGYQVILPTEYWVSAEQGVDTTALASLIRAQVSSGMSVVDRESEIRAAMRDPLKSGGWGDITVLAVAALAGVVLLGLLMYGALFYDASRLDMAVAHTFGFSRRQVLAGIAFERLLLIVTGTLAGWGVGLALSRWALGYLAVTPAGAPVVPSMLLTWSGTLLAAVIGSIVGATAVSLAFSIYQAASLQVGPVLRLEE